MHNGKFYGCADGGANNYEGVIYSYDTAANVYIDLYDFNTNDGCFDGGTGCSRLILASNGKLYGVTNIGGTYNGGVIFSFDLISLNYTVVYNLNYFTGANTSDAIMQANNGLMYGIVTYGGYDTAGYMFCLNPVTNVVTDIHDFNCTSGCMSHSPIGAPIQINDSIFIGTTNKGGLNNWGVIYSINVHTNAYTVLYNFTTLTGITPIGSLIKATNGLIYGVCETGGNLGYGLLFSFDISNNSYIDIHDFTGGNGGYQPIGNPVQATDGKLYGTTSTGGTNGQGNIYKYDLLTNTYTEIHSFNFAEGVGPYFYLNEVGGETTGIKEYNNNNYLAVYSNLDKITINYEINNQNSLFRLKDITGREVYNYHLNSSNGLETFNISSLVNGIYFWEVINNLSILSKGKIALIK